MNYNSNISIITNWLGTGYKGGSLPLTLGPDTFHHTDSRNLDALKPYGILRKGNRLFFNKIQYRITILNIFIKIGVYQYLHYYQVKHVFYLTTTQNTKTPLISSAPAQGQCIQEVQTGTPGLPFDQDQSLRYR